MRKSRLILAAPCTGKTFLCILYPNIFKDVDYECQEIYKKLDASFGKEWWLLKEPIKTKVKLMKDEFFENHRFKFFSGLYFSAERILSVNKSLEFCGVLIVDEEVHKKQCKLREVEDPHSPKWEHIKPGLTKYLDLVKNDQTKIFNMNNLDPLIMLASLRSI